MADNIAVTPGTGASVAADDVGGVLYQRMKLGLGADGVAADLAPATAAVQAAYSGTGAVPVANIGTWAKQHNPAVSLQATASQAAGAAGVRHVCTAISLGFSATTALGGITTVTFNLRDGGTGAGTILWAWQFTLPAAVVLPYHIHLSGLSFVGTAATAMTLESSALVTNLMEFVNLAGYDVA
jgi:hypothetical protein